MVYLGLGIVGEIFLFRFSNCGWWRWEKHKKGGL